MRPWSSTGTGWSAHSGSEASCCPKWRSLNISGSCSPMRRGEPDIDRQVSAARIGMLYCCVVMKKKLGMRAKLSIYGSISFPTLTYGHNLWVGTKRIRCNTNGKMSHLRSSSEIGWGALSIRRDSEQSQAGSREDAPEQIETVERMVYPLLDSDMLERLCLRIGWLYFEFGYFILGSEWPRLVSS